MKLNWPLKKQGGSVLMTKKLILVLVEGRTDKAALALVFQKILKLQNIDFEIVRTDMTADENMTPKYIVQRLEKEVNDYLRRNSFIKKSDIWKVIQLIDTDGAFVDTRHIVESEDGVTSYSDSQIMAKDRDHLIRRNISKRKIVYRLFTMDRLAGKYIYEIYYFSRNLEHVLHNLSNNLSDKEKDDLAFKTAIKYRDNPEEFLKFLHTEDICVSGTYQETWQFIMLGGNSLQRHCNLSVFFDQLLSIPLTDE